MKLKNVVFDLGGVLIDWNPRHLYKDIFESEEEMEHFLAEICNDEWVAHQDAGRPIVEATQVLCKQYPEQAHHIKTFYDRWHEMLKGEIKGTVAILKKLKSRGMEVYALTNWSHENFPYAKKIFPFLNDFTDIVVSGEEKIIKPDVRIFEILLVRNGLKAEESVFIDDRLGNVKAAEALGFTGIHFVSPQELHDELERLKLL
jgi:2-haloacid dehalogenase